MARGPHFEIHLRGELRMVAGLQGNGQELRRTLQTATAPVGLGVLQRVERFRSALGADRSVWQAELG